MKPENRGYADLTSTDVSSKKAVELTEVEKNDEDFRNRFDEPQTFVWGFFVHGLVLENPEIKHFREFHGTLLLCDYERTRPETIHIFFCE